MKKFIKQLEQFLGFNVQPQFAFAGGMYFEPQEEKKENPNLVFKGKGGGGVVEKPVYTAPPAAPAVEMAATLEEAITPEEEARRKQESAKMGAKSLQIPIVTADAGGQVGTGAGERTGAGKA